MTIWYFFLVDEEKPQIDEDIEVKRMKRLEQLRSKRPYHDISEDGSGWVSVSAAPKESDSGHQNSDMSPLHRQRPRYDTPSPEPEPRRSDSGREGSDLSPTRQRRRHYETLSPEPVSKPSGSAEPDPGFSPPRRPCQRPSKKVEGRNFESPNCPYISSPHHVDRSSEHQDLSPLRNKKKDLRLSGSPDTSPPRRPHLRPSERVEGRNSESPNCPNISSPHHVGQSSEHQDLSPLRKKKKKKDLRLSGSFDTSLPRRARTEIGASDFSPPRESRKEFSSSKELPKTGLISGKDIGELNAKTKKDDWLR